MIHNGTTEHTKAFICFSDAGLEAEYISGLIFFASWIIFCTHPMSVDAIMLCTRVQVCLTVCVCVFVPECRHVSMGAESLLSRRRCAELNIKA